MNRPKAHMKYRRSVYRKNRIKFVAVTVGCSLLAVALILLIVGNLLGGKVEQNEESRKKKQSSDLAVPHAQIQSINACPVPLSAEGSGLSTRISNAVKGGYSAACFDLDTSEGVMLYASDVAQSQGKQSAHDASELRTLKNAMSLFADSKLYTVGVTHASGLLGDDDLARSVAVGYHSALVAEALRGGVDDVLIYVGEIPAERYTELVRLSEQVRALCPDMGAVGISLPPSFFTSDGAEQLFEELWSAFDYIAVDLTAPDEGTSLADHVSSGIGNMLYYLLRYNVRVLLPNTDTGSLDAARAAVANNGSQNIQIMP